MIEQKDIKFKSCQNLVSGRNNYIELLIGMNIDICHDIGGNFRNKIDQMERRCY